MNWFLVSHIDLFQKWLVFSYVCCGSVSIFHQTLVCFTCCSSWYHRSETSSTLLLACPAVPSPLGPSGKLSLLLASTCVRTLCNKYVASNFEIKKNISIYCRLQLRSWLNGCPTRLATPASLIPLLNHWPTPHCCLLCFPSSSSSCQQTVGQTATATAP